MREPSARGPSLFATSARPEGERREDSSTLPLQHWSFSDQFGSSCEEVDEEEWGTWRVRNTHVKHSSELEIRVYHLHGPDWDEKKTARRRGGAVALCMEMTRMSVIETEEARAAGRQVAHLMSIRH